MKKKHFIAAQKMIMYLAKEYLSANTKNQNMIQINGKNQHV